MNMILLKKILLDGSKADILIDGARISRITPSSGDSSGESGAEIIDCDGKVAMPAFVNMHTHAAMALMRGMEEDVPLAEWLGKIWEREAKLDEEFVYHSTKVACLEMIKTGTVTFNDQYWFFPAAHRAAIEMGLRPAVSYVVLDHHDRDEAERQKEQCVRMYEEASTWNDGTIFTVSVHAVYSVSEDLIVWASDFARSHGLKLHIHIAESEKEDLECKASTGGLSPTEYLDRLGVLGPHVIGAHTLWLSEHDIELLGKYRVNCVHNINSNTKLASGYKFKYNELRDAGANVCIGTDGCASSNNLDMLEAMKTTALFQKAWRKNPAAMPLEELISMATVNGAKALGLDTGILREGALADILIVDTDNSFFLSPGSFLANFIYSAHSDCIDSVISGGRFVMRNRKVEGEKEILASGRSVLGKLL